MKISEKWKQRLWDWRLLWHIALSDHDVDVGSTIASAIYLVCMPIYFLVLLPIPSAPRWPIFFAAAVSALILVAQIMKNRRGVKCFLFVANVACLSGCLAVFYPLLAVSSTTWFPFQASKLLAFVVGFLAPGLLIGIASITIAIGCPIFQFLLFPEAIQARLRPVEPWGLLGFGVAALFILVSRLRVRQLEIRARALQLETESTLLLEKAFLEIRDLMNTPLQVIKISTVLLKKRKLDEGSLVILKRQEAACSRLKQLSQRLARFESRS